MAVGSGREIFDLFEAIPAARMQVTGIDLDAGAIAFCAEEARKRSLGEDKVKLHQANLVGCRLVGALFRCLGKLHLQHGADRLSSMTTSLSS